MQLSAVDYVFDMSLDIYVAVRWFCANKKRIKELIPSFE
jgi:hypothetical protein